MASGLRIPISGLKILPTSTSGILNNSKSLFAVLSRLPNDGVGQRVTQPRSIAGFRKVDCLLRDCDLGGKQRAFKIRITPSLV
jgi:hypothetical protein